MSKYTEQQTEEILDSLAEMVCQHCHERDDGRVDSGCLSANAGAIEILIEHSRMEQVGGSYGRAIFGRFLVKPFK